LNIKISYDLIFIYINKYSYGEKTVINLSAKM